MTQNYVCPSCGASNTRFRATLGSHVCQRCGHEWAPRQVGKRVWQSEANNIRNYAGGAAVVGFITVFINPLVGVVILLVAVGLGGYWFKLIKDETKKEISEATEKRAARIESNRCTKQGCGNILKSEEDFCTTCGTVRARPLTSSEFLRCGSCAREFDKNVQFCPGCGTQAY